MSEERIISMSEMMLGAMQLAPGKKQELPSVWKRVVSKVYNYGERLAGNTRVIDLKNGVLLIETDHSGWIQYLQLYQKFILTELRKELPELKISSLAFRVAGSSAGLSNTYEQQLEQNLRVLEKDTERQEAELNRQLPPRPPAPAEKPLPPEILEKFESLRKSMLTNPKK